MDAEVSSFFNIIYSLENVLSWLSKFKTWVHNDNDWELFVWMCHCVAAKLAPDISKKYTVFTILATNQLNAKNLLL